MTFPRVISRNRFLFLIQLALLLVVKNVLSHQNTPLNFQRLTSDRCRCGERSQGHLFGDHVSKHNFARIFGGMDAEPGVEKWMAQVTVGGHLCSGSVINSKVILTAAHCFFAVNSTSASPPESINLYLNRRSGPRQAADSQSEHRIVDEIIIHPEYSFPRFDVALLLLKDAIHFDESPIRPICLPDETDDYVLIGRKDGIAFGYGRMGPMTANVLPPNLQQTVVSFTDLEHCLRIYNYVLELAQITSKFSLYDVQTCFCSHAYIEGVELSFVLQGDSGGPVALPWTQGNSSRVVQIGVVSAGNGKWISAAMLRSRQVSPENAVAFYNDIYHILPFIESVSTTSNASWCTK